MREMFDGRLCRPAILVGVLAVAAFLVVPAGSVAQTLVTGVPFVLAVALLGMRVRASTGLARRRLRLLWAAASVYAAAMGVWFAVQAVLGRLPGFPSLLDVVFFAVFGTYIWFLTVVQRDRAEERSVDSRLALVDALILTTTLSAVLWVTAIEPNLDRGVPATVMVVSLLYPGLSTVMFAVAARLATSARFLRSGAGALLLLWVAAEVTGDVFYGFQTANGTFDHTSPVTALWMLAYTALAALAAHPDLQRLVDPSTSPSAVPRPTGQRARSVGRGALLCAALLPFVLAVVRQEQAGPMLAAGAVAFGLVAYRSLLLSGDLREQRRLTDELDAAIGRLAVQRDDLERLAFQDLLTGLGNRALFHRRMAEVVGHGTTPEFGLLMLDLDEFKVVNDSLGHETGDALLTAAADRLVAVVGDAGTVSRLGGDEFGVVLPGASEVDAVAVADAIAAALTEPFEVRGQVLHTGASIGVATQAAGDDVEALLRSVDLAMYAAKSAGKGTVRVFAEALLVHAQERLLLESHLRHALELGELSVAYQVIAATGSREVAGLEVLCRWNHPEWGNVTPDRFIPVAEATGLILPIGEWVMRTACRDAVALGVQLGRPLGVAVNVSVRQMQHPGFADVVASALADSGLTPQLLTVEVTESLMMDDDARSMTALTELHAMGVRISIDDFGTGHSSLARLRQLPVTEVKIDRSLVWEITASQGGAGAIAAAVIAMAGALGLTVVAEGVETEAQLDRLRRLGCDRVQGFLLARPVAIGDLELGGRVTPVPLPKRGPRSHWPLEAPVLGVAGEARS